MTGNTEISVVAIRSNPGVRTMSQGEPASTMWLGLRVLVIRQTRNQQEKNQLILETK